MRYPSFVEYLWFRPSLDVYRYVSSCLVSFQRAYILPINQGPGKSSLAVDVERRSSYPRR
jgi:hypothetical protein